MHFPSKFFLALVIALNLGATGIYSQGANTSLVCSGADNCNTCVRDSACFWCESKLLCKFYGAANREGETKDCGEWKWRKCGEPEDAPVIAIVSAAVSSVLICGRYAANENAGIQKGYSVLC